MRRPKRILSAHIEEVWSTCGLEACAKPTSSNPIGASDRLRPRVSPAALGTRTRPAHAGRRLARAGAGRPRRRDESATRILGREERRRERALVDPRHRLRYRAARLALRGVLGAYLNRSPAEIVLTREPCPLCGKPHGRPSWSLGHRCTSRCPGPGTSPCCRRHRFSRCGRRAFPRPADTRPLKKSVSHPTERALSISYQRPRRAEALLGCWVRKEAYLKGLGPPRRRSRR